VASTDGGRQWAPTNGPPLVVLTWDPDSGISGADAEGRRLARFFKTGHTPGRVVARAEPRNPNFPFTLDLRR